MLAETGMLEDGPHDIAWRTLNRKYMYKSDCIASEADTQLLLNVIDHLLNDRTNQQETVFEKMNDLLHCCAGFLFRGSGSAQ